MCRIARLFIIVILPWCLSTSAFASEEAGVKHAPTGTANHPAEIQTEGLAKAGWVLTFHDEFEGDYVRVYRKAEKD